MKKNTKKLKKKDILSKIKIKVDVKKSGWEERFDKKFPYYKGIGAPFPIFAENPNREWIKAFISSELLKQEKELREKIENSFPAGLFYSYGNIRSIIKFVFEELEK